MPTLFPHDLLDITDEPDPAAALEVVKSRFPTFDHYYVVTGCIPERRNRFETLWARYESQADTHFLRAIQQGFANQDFHSRTWEMYLGVVLQEHGFSLAPSRDVGPDFSISSPTPLYIEAVASSMGDSNNPDVVPGLAPDFVVMDVPEQQILLRLAQSMNEKRQRYERYLQQLVVDAATPFIVAVSAGAIPHPEDDEMPRMVKLLLGAGNLAVTISRIPDVQPQVFWQPLASVARASGTTIQANLFDDPVYRGVSGVIYSRTDVLNHPDVLGSDCTFIPNHNATNPVPAGTFAFLKEMHREGTTIRTIPPSTEQSPAPPVSEPNPESH